MNEVRNHLKANFILMNDIVFDDADFEEGGEFYNNGQGWEAIGRDCLESGLEDHENQFSGVFDGNNYKIVNLKQNITLKEANKSYNVGGFFNSVGLNGVIKNLTLENAKIDANKNGLYAILATSNHGEILNCRTTGSVNVKSGGYAGGISGGGAETYYCINKGKVESSYYAAGITAMAANFKGRGCYNTGSI